MYVRSNLLPTDVALWVSIEVDSLLLHLDYTITAGCILCQVSGILKLNWAWCFVVCVFQHPYSSTAASILQGFGAW